MGQSITLKIAGKDYPVVAPSPEHEQVMRFAAEEINKALAQFDQKYPDKDLADKLVFVTINAAVGRAASQQRERILSAEVEKLRQELGDYLGGIGNDTGSSAR